MRFLIFAWWVLVAIDNVTVACHVTPFIGTGIGPKHRRSYYSSPVTLTCLMLILTSRRSRLPESLKVAELKGTLLKPRFGMTM